jgi:hypothetical protein
MANAKRHIQRRLIWIIVIVLLGCSPTTTIPENIPMSEFIIGEWKVLSRTDTDTGNLREITYQRIRISDTEISYGDVHQAGYEFTEEDTIFVNNLRLTGGEIWRLERDNESLIIYQEYQDFRNTIILERVTR